MRTKAKTRRSFSLRTGVAAALLGVAAPAWAAPVASAQAKNTPPLTAAARKAIAAGTPASLVPARALSTSPALLPAAPQLSSPSGALALTLDEAISRALRVSPAVVQADGAVRSANAAQLRAVGAYLPNFSVSGGTGLSSGSAVATTVAELGSLNAGVGASWDVFTAGRRGAQRDRAEAQGDSARANLSASRAEVVLAVQRSFYDGLRANELTQVALARAKRAQEGLEAANRRASLGNATQSDVLRAQLELNNARQAVMEAQTQGRAAAFALGRWVGVDGAVNAVGGLPAEPSERTDAQALVEWLVTASPAVKAAEASAVAADAGVAVANSAYLPSVRLSAGYDWSSPGFSFNESRTGWSVRLGLSLPLFDGFAREESAVNARVARSNASSALADTKRAIRADAEQKLAQERLALQRIHLGRAAVEVAAQDLLVQKERYALGASTILELLTSQTNVVQAETDLVTARFDYQLARAEIEALSGRPS